MTRTAEFFSRVDVRPDGCWLWTGPVAGRGYGVMPSGPNRYAHRFSYTTFVGPIPDGLVIDHLCRNTVCVNPEHLEPVTSRENLLRGIGVAAQHAKATHCPANHPYDEANTYVSSKGLRYCRACDRERHRARRAS